MNCLTVKDLYEEMKQRVAAGQGDYVVFVTDDEEGNGFHALWFNGQAATDLDQDTRQDFEDINHDLMVLKENTDKAIYLG